MAMVVVDSSSLQADSQPKSRGLVWGSTAACALFCIHQMNRVNSRNGMWSWWQHYKYRPSIIIIIITEARLCRLPPLEGWISTSRPKLSRSFHAWRPLGWLVHCLNNSVYRLAQASVADIGICLIVGVISKHQGVCRLFQNQNSSSGQCGVRELSCWKLIYFCVGVEEKMSLCWLAAGGGVADCWWVAAGICGLTVAGGLSDPGHGLCRGPWRWTVPLLLCSWRTAWHTVRSPLDLCAFCD